jgi:hypothetical protein
MGKGRFSLESENAKMGLLKMQMCMVHYLRLLSCAGGVV